METFTRFVIIGLAQGATFALLAVGLTLIYGILGVLNFAHGSFAVLGVYLVYGFMVTVGLSYGLAVGLSAISVGVLGFLMIRLILIPLFRRNAPPLAQMLSTLGVGVAAERTLELVVGATPRTVPVGFARRMVDVGPILLNQQRLVAGVSAAFLIALVHLLVRKSTLGRQMRAVAQNPSGAALSGVNLNAVYSVTFTMGAALAAMAGALVLASAPITPAAGLDLTIKAFVVVIVGGLGNLVGATVMGLGLGVVEALAAAYWEPALAPVAGYLFMILVLLYKPKGLLSA